MQTAPLTLRAAFPPTISQPFFIFVCQKVLVDQLSHSQSRVCGSQSELVRPHFLTGCQRPCFRTGSDGKFLYQISQPEFQAQLRSMWAHLQLCSHTCPF